MFLYLFDTWYKASSSSWSLLTVLKNFWIKFLRFFSKHNLMIKERLLFSVNEVECFPNYTIWRFITAFNWKGNASLLSTSWIWVSELSVGCTASVNCAVVQVWYHSNLHFLINYILYSTLISTRDVFLHGNKYRLFLACMCSDTFIIVLTQKARMLRCLLA